MQKKKKNHSFLCGRNTLDLFPYGVRYEALLLRFQVGPLGDGLDLLPHELLELVGRLGVGGALVVVLAAVVEDEAGVADKVLRGGILVGLELVLHGAEVHGLLDDVVVVGDLVAVNRDEEGPG